MSERWDRHFLGLALAHARMSKDPSTQVGAVIVGRDREVLAAGFNGLPREIADTAARLHDREIKYKMIVHAEMNAVLAAARNGIRCKGGTLYLAAAAPVGCAWYQEIWGWPPCTRCTVELIQAGIAEIVSYPATGVPERWRDDIGAASALLIEAGILYREVEL